jgi:23S rRNA U2552 (ribose-2'-O)-methylase RlmE/FtsJ
MVTLDELANKYLTDKGTSFPYRSVHGYAPIYEDYLSKWRDKKIRLLEVGVCMESSEGGHSIRMWHEYFPNASIYAFDIVDMKKLETELGDRVKFFMGDQGSKQDIDAAYSTFGSKPFDFILEDGSHLHHHQMISFACLFPYVKSGGYYILEDVTEEGIDACCQRNDDTFRFIKKLKEQNIVSSEFISKEQATYIEKNVKQIDVCPDIKNEYRTIIIHKK